MERKSPFKRAKTIVEEKKADPVVPKRSIRHQQLARTNPKLLEQFKPPEKVDVELPEDSDECLEDTQVLEDDEVETTVSHDESSDDEGDFRSFAHDVIQKNGYRTVQKWFDLEAEPFKPRRKIVVTP